MKKWIAAILCMGMAVSICGCRQQGELEPSASSTAPTTGEETISTPQVSEEPTEPSETAAPTETEEESAPPATEAQDAPLVAVSLIPVLEEETSEDGTSIFQYRYQKIQAVMPTAPNAAEKITNAMEERIKKASSSVEGVLNWAKQDYTGDSNWVPYSYEVMFRPVRVDSSAISFFGLAWNFSGGVHPNRSLISYNFDAGTGDVLTLSDVLTNADVAEALYLKVMDGLDRRSEELSPGQSVWNDDYQEIVREHFHLEHTSSECWYFTETGMHFYFSPYEIAPYAVGEVDIEIAYSELNGILKETYFPEPATYEDTFSLNAARKEQIDATLFREHVAVNLEAEGTEIAVFTGAVIHQVQLEQDTRNTSPQQPDENRVIFAANRLMPQDLLLVTAGVEDMQLGLRLTLQSGETDIRSYSIRESAEDGSILIEKESE